MNNKGTIKKTAKYIYYYELLSTTLDKMERYWEY